jgi:hypothetical protein
MLSSTQNKHSGVKGGLSDFFSGSNLILLVTQDHMSNFKIVAYLLLGYFWLVELRDLVEIKGFH